MVGCRRIYGVGEIIAGRNALGHGLEFLNACLNTPGGRRLRQSVFVHVVGIRRRRPIRFFENLLPTGVSRRV